MTRPSARTLSVIDYHTEGEPMRFIVDGAPRVPGASLMEQSEHLAAHGRDLLGMALYEPRGHAAMCGAILTDPVTPGADVGVLFIEPLGPVHMCGHGAIALGAMLVETGRVAAPGGVATVTLDTPAGLVSCRVASGPGRPTSVTIRNVPAFSAGLDLHVEVPGLGRVGFDLAYGGHFYALVEAAAWRSSRRKRRGWWTWASGSGSPSRRECRWCIPRCRRRAACSTCSSTSRRGGPTRSSATRWW